MSIKNSELILNPDGSIYHLHLKPEDIADTIIFVGDQERVAEVTKHFDTIDFETQSREFKTQTGTYKGKRLSVISTGIGPDNIDIVLNELDALVNIDFETREIKSTKTSLSIVRIGTSGALQANIDIDSFVLSGYAMDINGMLQSYKIDAIKHADMEAAFVKHTQWSPQKPYPAIIENSKLLEAKLKSEQTINGLTVTCGGFYGPQGRVLRLELQDANINQKMDSFEYNGLRVNNFEMETSALYYLGKALGHNTLTICAIIGNRINQDYSKDYKKTVEKMIDLVLKRIC